MHDIALPRLASALTRTGRPKDPPVWDWKGLTRVELIIVERALLKYVDAMHPGALVTITAQNMLGEVRNAVG